MQLHQSDEANSPESAPSAKVPVLRHVAGAMGWAVLTCSVCFAILAITKALLPPQYWGAHTGLARFEREMSLPLLLFWVVLYSPILETFVGQLLPLEILRRFRVNQPVSIFIGAVVWAIVHYLSGGLLHAIVALGSGAMFSLVYLRYREPGVASAYATTALARAVNNCLLLIAVAYGIDA
ncbi:CPBP family glutamic-type intramembrane protease [Janthinobacterium sp. RB2R34]|uniref:CPBP family glutamic-type intramembrane protease n=1 Tax=Janthinobacterium sp. RB2R34 TaxID=3424193 RepID=UPI003F25EF95